MRSKINIFNIYPRRRREEAVAYERLPQSEVRLYTEICKFIISEFSSFVFKRGALGFSVLRIWPIFDSVFRFWCFVRFAGFLRCGLWFSVFVNNDGGFSDFSA